MQFKPQCLALLVAIVGQAAQASPSTSTISFSGAVQGTTCSISVQGVETPNPATVILDEDRADRYAQAGDVGNKTRLGIFLDNCSGPATKVRASFKGANGNTVTNGRLDNMATDNPARNLQLQISDTSYPPTVLNVGGDQSTAPYSEIVTGSAWLPYVAEYYATGPVTGGNFEAAVEFSIAYQ